MADPIPHELNAANGKILAVPGNGEPLPIARFGKKSLILIVGGSGSYIVQVSNTGDAGAAGEWVTVATGLVAGASPHLITTEHGVTPRLPEKVGFLRIVTTTFNAGDKANLLGEDQH